MKENVASLLKRTGFVFVAVLLVRALAFAACPIPDNGSLFVRVPMGNLVIDTSNTDAVEVTVSNTAVHVEELCFADHVEISGEAPARVYGSAVDWNIRVPRTVTLDLVTLAGSIRIANTDSNVTARTTGGSITVGNVGGNAALATQGGSVIAGNIGGNAEVRSQGGEIHIEDVAGNAELRTAGPITIGRVSGQIRAETAGGTIQIEESGGDLTATTLAGDILIGASSRTTVETGGGNIVGLLIHGPFRGSTALGNIRLERAESSIEATTENGDIEARLVPPSLDRGFQITLRTQSGNIRLAIPGLLPADLEATVTGEANGQSIRSDFPIEQVNSAPNLPPFFPRAFAASSLRTRATLNGGGNRIELQTSRGIIEILQNPR